MVTSFDSINIEVLDKVHICSIPTIAIVGYVGEAGAVGLIYKYRPVFDK